MRDDGVLPTSQSLFHNMSASLSRNKSDDGPLQLTLGGDADDNTWFIHKFDNSTLVNNAPYVGVHKDDPLTQHLLVGHNTTQLLILVCFGNELSAGLRSERSQT